LLSTNNGTTWQKSEISPPQILRSVTSLSNGSLFIAGTTDNQGSAVILRSNGFGTPWETINTSGMGEYRHIRNFSEGKMLVLYKGLETYGIFMTLNGGTNWQQVLFGQLNSMYFYNSMEGLAVGNGGIIYRSTDGGSNWVNIPSPVTKNLNDVNFSMPIGYAVGDEQTILKTTDNGVSWVSLNNSPFAANLMAVDFADNNTAVIVGTQGAVLRTTDSGLSWFKKETGNIGAYNDVEYYYATSTFIAAGDGGRVARSLDAGLNWNFSEVYEDKHLYGIHIDPQGSIYIVGGRTLLPE
jgi:photosystem II stability/assembly factor-like uncharacterized protein